MAASRKRLHQSRASKWACAVCGQNASPVLMFHTLRRIAASACREARMPETNQAAEAPAQIASRKNEAVVSIGVLEQKEEWPNGRASGDQGGTATHNGAGLSVAASAENMAGPGSPESGC